MEVTIKKAEKLKELPDDSGLDFGTIFTDHMFNMDYSVEKGWYNPRIEPYSSIVMDPSSMVLHYGQAVFEGLKAFYTSNSNITMFRPKKNMARLNRSSHLLCIPQLDEKFLLDAIKQLINVEKNWVPKSRGTSLYIRPTIIAIDPFIGVRASHTYRLFVILSPVGAYYSSGFNPVKIWVAKDHVRAVRGGVGEAKTAGNYAASLFASEAAKKEGYNQVLWLDGIERKYIEEVGAMNIFFVIDDEIITPQLNGSILPGITRESVIELARMWDIKVSERKISIDELSNAHKSGSLKEVFGSGTAAVISPVGEIKYGDNKMIIGDGNVGPVSNRLFKALMDIQYGDIEAPEGWIETL